MIKKIEIKLTPEESTHSGIIKKHIELKSGLLPGEEFSFRIIKKSIDARSRHPFVILLAQVYINELPDELPDFKKDFKEVSDKKKVIVVGSGPAGYFAALELIGKGIKPVIFERGKNVRDRRKDLRAIQQFSVVNPDSNYCFGEGGAGTYSDGKLYTRSHKRGDIFKILKLLVEHGAKSEILYESHPHIGSNKLPVIIQNIRETILQYGGEVYFNSRVTDIIINNEKAEGVKVNDTDEHFADAVILATGHSARDIFYILKNKKIELKSKPFALGVRAEHPQALIDEIQYRQNPRDRYLPAASYKLAEQIQGRGVFSFCMCPGGLIVPSATSPGELVVNGMSMSRRDSEFANSGIVVTIEKEDLKEFAGFGEFDGLEFQKQTEKKFFDSGDGSQKVPAQKITDFVNGKLSSSIIKTSYIPGVYSCKLDNLLPESVSVRLKKAFVLFGKKMRGYYTDEAYICGPESRTSSPVRIPRNSDSFEQLQIQNLYPCGEGAGYAGGIISAAMDGQNAAKKLIEKVYGIH